MRTSSLIVSKNTMDESNEMPMDTTMPTTPASVTVALIQHMITQSIDAEMLRLPTVATPSSR